MIVVWLDDVQRNISPAEVAPKDEADASATARSGLIDDNAALPNPAMIFKFRP
jgi:hypothetical protein